MINNQDNKLPDIVRTEIMDAAIEKVWTAIATSEGLAVWLLPNDFQPKLGHRFTFKSPPKMDWDGIIYCEVKELNPPYKLGFTWCGNNLEQYVEIELKEIGCKTELKLIHSGWSEEHAKIREIMYKGWGDILGGFKKKLGDEDDRYIN